MNSFKELFIYHSVRVFGIIIRAIPLSWALFIGRLIGVIAYYFDTRHRSMAYANIQVAFSQTRTPDQIKKITRELFVNYGQNLIELLRLPLLTKEKFDEIVTLEGKEVIDECLKKGKGIILLAMHFGSWEIASLSCAMLGYPYKVLVNPQVKYSKLDELLNSFRMCGGTVVLSRGMDNREFIRSLKNNEAIGMVVDQGGRDGMLVPFFGRRASMSVGAVRVGLKWGVPLCFSIIIREGNGRHRMIINKPLELDQSEDLDTALAANLKKVTATMEHYIEQHPAEYMWFYKIWKYSNEVNVVILSDGKTGHLRQSQMVAEVLQEVLLERGIQSKVKVVNINFRNAFCAKVVSLLSVFFHPFLCQGRIGFWRRFLTEDSFVAMTSMKSEFVISCGSSVASLNFLLAQDCHAKNIAILKPGLMPFSKFNLVILPEHDITVMEKDKFRVISTVAAPNLITDQYLKFQSERLVNRFSHLKGSVRRKIGLFIGGDAKDIYLSEGQIKLVIAQCVEAAEAINAELLVTTSRRTPERIESILLKELKRHPRCPLMIIARQDDIPEAVGGILGLCDVAVVSGDSISMVSEAASSGKETIAFFPQLKGGISENNKHYRFLESLHGQGYIVSADPRSLGRTLVDTAKGKIKTKRINDRTKIYEALKFVI